MERVMLHDGVVVREFVIHRDLDMSALVHISLLIRNLVRRWR